MSKITGKQDIFPQPTSYGRTEAGQFSTIPFESTNADKINQLAATFDVLGYVYDVEHSFGKSKLTVHLSYNQNVATEQPVDLWEYIGQKSQKDLLSASVPSGITATLSQRNVELIRKCLANDFSDTADQKTLVQSDFSDGNSANAFTLYKLMKTGVTDGIIQTPVLRHTQTVSFIYPITLSKLNIGRIISTVTLIALENPPTWAVSGLPTDLPPGFSTMNTAFGWFKNAPTIQQIAYQKVQLVQEFEYGLWSTDIFGQPL